MSRSARACSISGSSMVNGSRIRSAMTRAGRLAAVQRLEQELFDLTSGARPVSSRCTGGGGAGERSVMERTFDI